MNTSGSETNAKILIVDDRAANLHALRVILDGMELAVLEATSGEKALSLMLAHEIALVLLDVDMPVMDGYEVAGMMGAVEATRAIPIIFITAAYRDRAHRLKGYGVGAVDYIEKPIDEDILRSKVRVFIELHLSRKRLAKLSENYRLAHLRAERERKRAQTYLDVAGALLLALNRRGEVALANRETCKVLGVDGKAILGVPWFERFIAKGKRDQQRQAFDQLFTDAAAANRYRECLILTARGEERLIAWHDTLWDDEESGERGILSSGEDITERRQTEERLRLMTFALDQVRDTAFLIDEEARIHYANQGACRQLGFTVEEFRELRIADIDPEFPLAEWPNHWLALAQRGSLTFESTHRRKDGTLLSVEINANYLVYGDQAWNMAIARDIGERKALEEERERHQRKLEHLAFYDTLTDLPNRRLLADRMRQAMATARRVNGMLAVAYLDLDGFKPINDRFGHAAGDQVLVEVARRIKGALREMDTLARLGGDEFVILLGDLRSLDDCTSILSRILDDLRMPFPVGGERVQLSGSIGVTLYPEDAGDPDSMVRHSDQAMYLAKEEGKGRIHFFDLEKNQRARLQRDLPREMDQAIARDELRLHYQPKVNMRQGRVEGVEALVRWHHPRLGWLPPERFLPAIARHRQQIDLDWWVLQRALERLNRWQVTGNATRVSINLSARTLQTEEFLDRLKRMMARYPRLDPAGVRLEIVESEALEDLEKVSSIIEACRGEGISFALDDFGTGYSSLTYFRRLPAAELKIDKSFVLNILEDMEDFNIVEGVIGLARAFQRDVTAEGVASIEHGALLMRLGCDIAQGFGIAKPMPSHRVRRWIREYAGHPRWHAMQEENWSLDNLPLLSAGIEHRAWMRQLEQYLEAPEASPAPPMDEHYCRFGHWLEGGAARKYARHPLFATLVEKHQALHGRVRQVILTAAGDPAAARKMVPELRVLSAALVERLYQLNEIPR